MITFIILSSLAIIVLLIGFFEIRIPFIVPKKQLLDTKAKAGKLLKKISPADAISSLSRHKHHQHTANI